MHTHVIDMGDYADRWAGQTATIRFELSFSARRRVEAARTQRLGLGRARAHMTGTADDEEMSLEVDTARYSEALLTESVVEWSLLGFDGEVLPVTVDAVRGDNAPDSLLSTLVLQIQEHYESLDPTPKEEPG